MSKSENVSKKQENDVVVAFRCLEETKNDIDLLCKLMKVSKKEWLEDVVYKQKNAVNGVQNLVKACGDVVDVIDTLKVFCLYAPNKVEARRVQRALDDLKEELKKALAMAC